MTASLVGKRTWLQRSTIAGAVLLLTLAILGAGRDHPTDAVLNPSAAANPSDWRASSDAAETSVTRVAIEAGPEGAATAIDVRRKGDGGAWAHALCGLRDPASFLRQGHTYRMQVYARDLRASGQSLGMLLANGNFEHRPTLETRYERFTDQSWHLLQRTFTVTNPADADTALYFDLPVHGSLRWQFTLASVREVEVPEPHEARGDADRVIGFAGPAGAAPDRAIWNHELGGNGWGANELQTYTDSTANASVDGHGNLVLTARHEQATGPDGITRSYTSARLSTQGKVEVQPGSYLEAAIRAPTGLGVRPAFWLIGANWPDVGWPASGELDVMEATRRSPAMVRQAIHFSRLSRPRDDAPYGENAPGGYTTLDQPRDAATHTYGVYFDDRLVQFYVDRKPTLRLTAQEALEIDRSWPFDRPQLLVLNVAVGGGADDASFPARMTVGRIAVWSAGVPF